MSLHTIASLPKYGLIKKGGPPTSSQQPRPKAHSARSLFDESGDNDEDEVPGDMKKVLVQRSLAAVNTVDRLAVKALEEDPNIFDYDGAMDNIQASKNSYMPAKSLPTQDQPKARYITSLKAAAQVREKEHERAFERQLLKERAAEDAEFGDQPKYITSAYKQKLLEEKKWEYEDKMTEEVEKRHDVRTQGMQGFYANLLTKNVAMGGDVKSNALSAYTAGSERQGQVVQTMMEDKESFEAVSSKITESEHDERPTKIARTDDSRSSHSTNASTLSVTPREPERPDEELVSKPVPVVDRTVVVTSAKERYLARKRLAGGTNGDN